MTPEERQLLTQFLGDLVQTKGVVKDQEAAAMIESAIRSNPDGAYVLVQHALLADQALHQAQARIAQLQAAQFQGSAPSFLGGGVGSRTAQPQPQSPWSQAAPPPPPQEPPAYASSGLFSGGGGLGSFLRTAGTTAAGVAGGEMLFSGLSGLFGGHHGGFGGGGFGGGGFEGGGPVENVTVNNYGDDSGGYDDGGFGGDGGGDDYS